MTLFHFHRVLISAAILFDVFFTVFCIRKYNRNGDAWELVLGIGSSVLTIGLIFYLMHFNRKVAAMQRMIVERAWRCPGCQYDLRPSLEAKATTCPECGKPITEAFRRNAMANS